MGAELNRVAQELVAPGKGILAADESTNTIKNRLDTIGVESTQESRRLYRQLLFTTPGIQDAISGAILYIETTQQTADDGTPFVRLLTERGIHPGIKTDEGLETFGKYEEQTTKGLESLETRSRVYQESGLVFAKARSVYKITDNTPTDKLIEENARFQGKYAAISQSEGLMPIVEPEVSIEGSHDINKSREVSIKVLGAVFDELRAQGVDLSGILLKPSMVTPGKGSLEQVSDEEIARNTVEVLLKTVPKEVPGIVFLSGGQTPDQAANRLLAMNKLYKHLVPWELSYSFGRALQDKALRTWAGKSENVVAAQEAFRYWAVRNGQARL